MFINNFLYLFRDMPRISPLFWHQIAVLFEQRRFNSLDSGCNGVIFVQMRKRDGDPSPKDIVQHMVTSVASTRKHMSRFTGVGLDLLPLFWWIGDPIQKACIEYSVFHKMVLFRFLLRVLPVEVTCYASEDEITKAIKPLISQYFPVETQIALKVP